MKVLITGSTGFIGSALLKLAVKNTDYTEIYTVSRTWRATEKDEPKHKGHYAVDLSLQSEAEWLFQQVKPDIIFHLAGNPIVKVDEKNINAAYSQNVLTTHNLVHFCPKGCKFILASTILVYGLFDRYGEEYYINETSPTIPNSVYALSKLAAEEIAFLYDRREEIELTIARLCANVGPGATHGVLRDFIAKAKSDNPYFEIIGDEPGSAKPFMYVYDTAALLMFLAKLDDGELIYNLCPSDNINTLQISKIVQEELGTNKPIKWLGEQANWVGDDRCINVDSINHTNYNINWQFNTSEKAIRESVKWIK